MAGVLKTPLSTATIAALERYSETLCEVSDHTHLAAIAVALCLLPAPPAWAVGNRDMVRDLGRDGAEVVAGYEAEPLELGHHLEHEAAYHRLAIGDSTWHGPATAADVANEGEIADALRTLAAALTAAPSCPPSPGSSSSACPG